MSSTVKKDDFVRIAYTARLEDGTVIDTTDAEVAKEHGIFSENANYGDIVVVVGERQVITGLDEALEGKEIGFKGEISVPPEKAFGEYNPDNKEFVSIARLKEKPKIGQRIRIDNRFGTVERIIGRRAIIDFNHPFAGKNIIFDLEIKERVEEPEEKIDALFYIYTAKHVDVKFDGKKVRIEIPRGASIDQFFVVGKYSAVNGVFKHLDIDELEIVEVFKKEDELALIGESKETEEGEETSEAKAEEVADEEEEDTEKEETIAKED
jgi:FKBP-type peptidyl-prolyl cis-trans isomerase SlyD